MRKSEAGALLACLGVAFLTGCSPRAEPDLLERWRHGAAGGYDLLLVTLDTTRADHIGAYGAPNAETPNLDRLARSGVRFSDAMTAVPLTLPSHSTILTGRLPPHHGVRNNAEFRLGETGATLADLLQRAGYSTAAFVSAFVLDARFGTGRGFETYDDRVEPEVNGRFALGTLERKAPATTDALLEWYRRQVPDRRLFAWVHYFDAHAPYEPPSEIAARFAGRLYDGEIALVDRELGRVLQAVETSGRGDRTLIVVVGDHGESLGEHGEATHGHFIYDATMRVPLILNAPAILGSCLVDDRVVSTVDLLPTLTDLLGIQDPDARDGVSWVGGANDPRRSVYLENLSPWLDFGWAPLYGRRTLRAKAILAPRNELYDLADDSRELHNLFPEGSRGELRGAELFAELEKAEEEREAAPPRDSTMGAEERAKLAALGYLSGAGPTGEEVGLADPKDLVAVHSALIEANAASSAGRLDVADRWLRQAAAASPRDRSILFALGKLQLQRGETAAAERSFRALSSIHPRVEVSILLAQIALATGREAEAERWLEQAEQLDPRHGGIFIARGDLLLGRGDRIGAEASYQEASKVDPYRAGSMAAARLRAMKASEPRR